MKVALVAINARYSHSNLAIKYLKEKSKGLADSTIVEFTINDQKETIIHYLIEKAYSHIGFSTYIWNVEMVSEIICDLKNIDESITIFAGGPEVSFESKEFMDRVPLDYLMVGEGEDAFIDLLKLFMGKSSHIGDSILYRKDGNIKGKGKYAIAKDIGAIYLDDKYIEENRYIYYEASRGCPFNCAFCLSSNKHRTIFKDISIVKKELKLFLDKGVDIVKFIDRSFNFNPHAKDIMRFLIDRDNKKTTFHLEIHPSLIDQEFIDLVKSSRPDLFQFEIGIQTTNDKTADEIQRVGKFTQIKDICSQLINSGAHIHMDLIAGLAYEGLESFKKSFNDLYYLGPEKIQVGFLKLLKGSRLRIDKDKYSYKYFTNAPYEVISNKWIGYGDIIHIKGVEDMVERYYNEGYFHQSLTYIVDNYYESPWDFFSEMASYWKKRHILYTSVSRINLFNILISFLKDNWNLDYIHELIIYDYYKSANNRSSKFSLVNYHKSYDKTYLVELIKENSEKIRDLGFDPETILKHSTVEIFKIDENLLYNDKDNYHIFIKKGNGKTLNFVLGGKE